jgi:hypothetical protein
MPTSMNIPPPAAPIFSISSSRLRHDGRPGHLFVREVPARHGTFTVALSS